MSEHSHQPCPFTSCGSSDAFSWNTDGFGKCHACDGGYPSKRQTFDWSQDKYPVSGNKEYEMSVTNFTPKRIEDVSDGKYANMRSITSKTMEDFGVVTYGDDSEAPTDAQITAKQKELKDAWDAKQYQRDRAKAYPHIYEQLDMLFHAIDSETVDKTSDFYIELKKVKDASPKA